VRCGESSPCATLWATHSVGTRALTPDGARVNARTNGAPGTGKPLKDTPYVKDVLRAISTISIPRHLLQKHVDQASGVVKDIVSRKQASGIFCDLSLASRVAPSGAKANDSVAFAFVAGLVLPLSVGRLTLIQIHTSGMCDILLTRVYRWICLDIRLFHCCIGLF
jgi:hypothetical protein